MCTEAGYLAAMIDGEGSVAIARRDGRIKSRYVCIVNTDESIIEACEEACRALGITFTRSCRRERARPLFHVGIYGRANLERLLEVVPLRSGAKAERLREAVESYQQRHHRVDQIPEDVRRLYVDEGRSGPDVAAMLGVAESTLYGWMDKLGIERRGRWG